MLTQRRKQALPAETNLRKRSSNHSKPSIESEIALFLLGYLEGYNVPTCLFGKASEGVELRPLSMIPLGVSVWNTATGDYSKRLGLKDGHELEFPVIEHHYARPDLGNPLLNEFHMYSLKLVTPEQLRLINRLASKANIVLRSFFGRRALRLDKLGLEFGMFEDQIMVGKEISPRTSLFTDLRTTRDARKGKVRGDTRRHVVDRRDSIEWHEEIRSRIIGAA